MLMVALSFIDIQKFVSLFASPMGNYPLITGIAIRISVSL